MVLLAGALLAIAGSRWRELAIQWRLAELARPGIDAELPAEFLLAGPGTVKSDVLGRYLRTPAGKERLLRSYLGHVEGSHGEVGRYLKGAGAGGGTAILLFWMAGTRSIDGLVFPAEIKYLDHPCKNYRKLSSYLEASPDSLPLRLQELLVDVGYEDYPLPRTGGRFSVVSGPGAPQSCGRVFSESFPWGVYACLIESETSRLDPCW